MPLAVIACPAAVESCFDGGGGDDGDRRPLCWPSFRVAEFGCALSRLGVVLALWHEAVVAGGNVGFWVGCDLQGFDRRVAHAGGGEFGE